MGVGEETVANFIKTVSPGNWVVTLDGFKVMSLCKNGFTKLDIDPPCQLYISLFVEEEDYDIGGSLSDTRESRRTHQKSFRF